MPPVLIAVMVLAGILIFMLSGLYVALSLGVVGIFVLEIFAGLGKIIGGILYNTASAYILAAIPFFVLMGEIALNSGLSSQLFTGVSKWTRIFPGGLVLSNILSSAIFAAISGSSIATAATIGTVAYPEQAKRGYNPTLITGSIAAGGTLGILIPPSMTMIIYGGFTGTSVGQLFIAGIIPGIILTLMFMSYVFLASLIKPSLAPAREKLALRYFKEAIIAFKDIWQAFLIIVLIIAGIYGGFMTPTEAAAMSVILALLLGSLFGKMDLNVLKKSAMSALRTTSFVVFVIIGANILSQGISMLKLPTRLTEIVVTSGVGPLWIWFAIVLLILIMGCFMAGIPLLLLTLPITYPLMVTGCGFDPVWFGIMNVILLEIGGITPPVGTTLYVVHGISKLDIKKIAIGIIPFVMCHLILLTLCTFMPQLVLFLTRSMAGR